MFERGRDVMYPSHSPAGNIAHSQNWSALLSFVLYSTSLVLLVRVFHPLHPMPWRSYPRTLTSQPIIPILFQLLCCGPALWP